MSDILGRSVLFLTTNAKGLEAGIGRGEKRVRQFERTTARIGRKAATNLTLPILAIGGAAAKIALDFESSLSQIVGLVGVSRDQVNAWEKDIRDCFLLSSSCSLTPI